MRTIYLWPLMGAVTLTLLAACGGNSGDAAAAGAFQAPPLTIAAAPLKIAAAPLTIAAAPRADCESEGCSAPRIIDGLAEQYRASAIEQQAEPAPPPAAAGARRPPAGG